MRLDPQNPVLTGLAVPAALTLICVLLWLFNKLLRRVGLREHHVDRVGSGLLEMERLVRPRAEHVIAARRERRAEQANANDDPPE